MDHYTWLGTTPEHVLRSPNFRQCRPPTPPAETKLTLQGKLAEKSTESGKPKTAADFGWITQSDVDDWNEFMGLSAQYHYVGIGEQERLKAYMGDIDKEFQRSVKGEKPQTPEATFRANFVALGLTPAKDWEEYYEVSAKLASDVRQKAKITMRLRKQALEGAAAARLREKGLVADREWQTHQDQIEGYDKAWDMAEGKESEIEKYRAMWPEESKLYARDPKGYKWKDPSK